jgi:hypothetical protein
MLKVSTVFLQTTLVLIGLAALVILIRFPLTEGRASNLDLFSIYADPFIIYAYVASISFFIALYNAFILLGYISNNKAFTTNAAKALKIIKYCAIALSAFIVLGAVFIKITHDKADDSAGFLAMSVLATFVSIIVATLATLSEKLLQDVLKMKSEIDLFS